MNKFVKLVFLFTVVGFLFSGNAMAATSVDVLNESKQIYTKYFQQGKHVDNTKLTLYHNGPGSKNSEQAGFFRSATDAIFLISLHSRLNETNDVLKTSVNRDAIATLDHLRDRMKLSGPYNHRDGWRLNATQTPDAALALQAFSKAIVDLNLTSTQKNSYLSFADELALALKNARDRHKSDYSSTWPQPVMVSCSSGLQRTAIKHNILAMSAGGLGAYAHPNVRGRYNQYREVMTDFAIYAREAQIDLAEGKGLWLNGGGAANGCQMEMGYAVWDIVGLSLAAKGSLGTTGTTVPTGSSFFTSAQEGVIGLDKHYIASDNNLYEHGTGVYGGNLSDNDVSSYALPVSHVNTSQAENLFYKLYPAAKTAMVKEQNTDPFGRAPHFHRLIHGLAGALDNRY